MQKNLPSMLHTLYRMTVLFHLRIYLASHAKQIYFINVNNVPGLCIIKLGNSSDDILLTYLYRVKKPKMALYDSLLKSHYSYWCHQISNNTWFVYINTSLYMTPVYYTNTLKFETITGKKFKTGFSLLRLLIFHSHCLITFLCQNICC